jgi:site-specific DNA recombinase
MQAVIYTRFSPRKKAHECESCQTQLDYCSKYCQIQNLEIIADRKDEAKSGACAANRPGLQEALAIACRHKAVLVVYSLSRLARNTKEAIEISEQLDKAGADLISLHEKIDTTTAMGRFVFKLLAAIAELEREQIAERTSEAMRHHQANGRRMSDRTPYGWMRDPENPKRMIENADEQIAITQIKQLAKSGLGLRKICHQLESNGIYCRGNNWHHSTIERILKRPEQFTHA